MLGTPRLHAAPGWLRGLLGGLIGLLAGLLLVLLRPLPIVEIVELQLLDLQTASFTLQRPPDPRIVLAEIGDDDVDGVFLDLVERWPWSLEYNAAIFDLMAQAGVAAVLVDVFHLDRGSGPDDHRLGPAIVSGSPAEMLLYGEKEGAAAYGEALRSVGSAVLAFELSNHPTYQLEARVEPARERLGGDRVDGGPDGYVRSGAELPVLAVLEGGALVGFANVQEDADGIVRRAPVVGRWGSERALSIPLAGLLLALDETAVFEDDGLRVGDVVQPVMDDGSFLVNFHERPGDTFPRVAPVQILSWAMRRETEGDAVLEEARKVLQGSIVVWGINLAGQKDIVTTPLSGAFHGPEYQATILDNLIHGDGRVRASRLYNAIVLLVVTILLGVLAGSMRGRRGLNLTPLLVIVAGLAFALWRFDQGTAIDVFTPFLGVVLTWGGTAVLHILTDGRRNRWLEGTFGRYLAPSIIEALKQDPTLLSLGGKRREITILFSDVAGFTKLSEALEPEQVVELLNRYLTAHSAAVMAYGGVVDKFEGDAVMAFFGDPVDEPLHAEKACRTAIQVMADLPKLAPTLDKLGLKDFGVRIGLNSGMAVVGNMGSEQRFDYTCMGDSVNLASRLEGANKAFGSHIMIGSRTLAEAGDAIVTKPLAAVVVVGRGQAEPVHELLAMRGEADPDVVAHATAFAEAHAAALRGDVEGARLALAEAGRLRPGDGPVAWMGGLLDRLEAGEEASPWSGELVLTGK